MTGQVPGRLLQGLAAGAAWAVLHPMRLPPILTPGIQGLPYRALWLQGSGVRLAAWHVPCPGSRAGIVLCHGHNNSRAQFFPMLRPLHEAGFHLLLFDHRTMGVSQGGLCTYGDSEHDDLLAALAWLRTEGGVERTGLYGISMGGATSLLAAARDPRVEAVVTDSAFARLEDVVERKLRYLPGPLRTPLARELREQCEAQCGADVADVDPEAAVRRGVRCPVLLIHGERDMLIPVEHAGRLAAAAEGRAECWVVPGAGHVACRARAGREYPRRVTEFFRRHLGAPAP